MALDLAQAPSFLVMGPRGSGITSALQAFLELGYQTLAGIAPELVESYLESASGSAQPIALYLGIDPFTADLEQVQSVISGLKSHSREFKVLYLSTPAEVLMGRFHGHEKAHPFEAGRDLKSAIDTDVNFYKHLKPLSDYHIDTNTTTARELGLKIARVLKLDIGLQPMTIHLMSFGFKYGIPTDAEMVFDMRFLPNPFYDPRLRPQSGLDTPVSDYVFSFPETGDFLHHWQNLMVTALPMYQKQGKTRLKVAIGCTGGQHRSVAMTMAIAQFLKDRFPEFTVDIHHREQHHWPQPVTPG